MSYKDLWCRKCNLQFEDTEALHNHLTRGAIHNPHKPEPPPAQAPREWRIVSHYSTDYDAFKWTMTHGSTIDRTATNQEIIHVIEYAAYLREKQHATILFNQNEERTQAYEALERELAEAKSEYANVCKFATQFEEQLAEARADLSDQLVQQRETSDLLTQARAKLAESERFNANHKEIAARLKKELTASEEAASNFSQLLIIAEAENARLRGALERIYQNADLADQNLTEHYMRKNITKAAKETE